MKSLKQKKQTNNENNWNIQQSVISISETDFAELVKFGIKSGYLRIRNNRIEYTYSKKTYNFKDPEEKLRAATYVRLIEHFPIHPLHRIMH